LLAEAIKLLVTSPELRKNMGAKGRELVVNAYSWSTTVEKWLAELNNKIDV
jgi:glycosyltransferase involved in cell wall biosynthesis